MALPQQNVLPLVFILALLQALQDGRITPQELRNLITILLVASVLVPQLFPA